MPEDRYNNEHVQLWRKRNATRLDIEAQQREGKCLVKQRKVEKFREICRSHGITDMTTNGYVYHFHYDGMAYVVADQVSRLLCTIHRPFLTKEDEDRYREGEHDEMRYSRNMGGSSPFQRKYEYVDFIIYGNRERALRKLLRGWRPYSR